MKPCRILIIDDERVVCNGCRLALSEMECEIDVCLTGREGLEAILANEYDVALLDMKLPDMEGMEILKRAQSERPGAYVIVMTGYSTVQNAVEAMKLGAFDYITKPFTDDEIALAVERAVDKKRLVEENLSLRRELLARFGFDNIVGENPAILRIFEQIQKVAPTDTTVLIYGESGTGKELFAGSIHAHSKRAARQFIAVDCSTLSPGLLESELFGHVKGAFTGAVQDKSGIFEVADGGTLFLDDVANLNMDIQAKLLRVLETHEYKPVGASYSKKTNARIIAATNKDLKAMVTEGRFREDLFYRLNVFPVSLPPLRERRDDIPKLAYHFLRHFCRKTGKRVEGFSDSALEMLANHDWPGNVRQLKNVIERLVILSEEDTLDLLYMLEHMQMKRSGLGDSIPETVDELNTVKKHLLQETFGHIQKAFLIKALKASKGNISRAADKVGMQRSNFHALMKKHHISAKSF
jgi:two-component system NtrC family response regulator